MNKLTPEDIEWIFVSSLGMTEFHHIKSINKIFGLQKETITKRRGDFDFGSSKTYYYINGCEREFTDIQTLCDCWNELNDFDDPNDEIVWVKIIKSKDRDLNINNEEDN